MVCSQGVGRREAFKCFPDGGVCGNVPRQGARRPGPSGQRLRAPGAEGRGGEGATWWERARGPETLHPAVPACSPVPPRSPASRPPALQKTRSSPVLKLTADWKIQFPCELLGTWGLLIFSESPGRLSQECRQGYGAALLRADDARLCFPAEPGEMPVAP